MWPGCHWKWAWNWVHSYGNDCHLANGVSRLIGSTAPFADHAVGTVNYSVECTSHAHVYTHHRSPTILVTSWRSQHKFSIWTVTEKACLRWFDVVVKWKQMDCELWICHLPQSKLNYCGGLSKSIKQRQLEPAQTFRIWVLLTELEQYRYDVNHKTRLANGKRLVIPSNI